MRCGVARRQFLLRAHMCSVSLYETIYLASTVAPVWVVIVFLSAARTGGNVRVRVSTKLIDRRQRRKNRRSTGKTPCRHSFGF